jgi:polysaccharide deacetylase 2 family uncharacterized protein YibQ
MPSRKRNRVTIVIIILSALVVLQTALLIKLWPRKPKIIAKPKIPVVAEVAIIIDDWGYNPNNLNFLKEINIPLDISVLPFLPYSKEVAKQAHFNHKEIMLHLPLEPHPSREVRLEKKVILTNMTKEQILKILDEAIDNAPFCKGINNHMGSLATENKYLMSVIFQEMKKRNLFFVDSLVTRNSICPELAEEFGVKFAERSVFLDNKNDADYIRGQFSSLVKKAKRLGSAIGIGHDHPLTLKLIKELAPETEKQGIKFVFVSELVK